MTEEQINNIIKKLESYGYLFEADGPDTIGFWKPEDENGDRGYQEFKSWEDASEFLEDLEP